MTEPSAPSDPNELGSTSQVLGGLPIINAVTDRLRLLALLAAARPAARGAHKSQRNARHYLRRSEAMATELWCYDVSALKALATHAAFQHHHDHGLRRRPVRSAVLGWYVERHDILNK